MTSGVYVRTKKHRRILRKAMARRFKKIRIYRACLKCGKRFYVTPSHFNKEYCSSECFYQRNGNRVEVECKFCRKKILVLHCDRNRKFCNHSCSAKMFNSNRDYSCITGENSPSKRLDVRKKLSDAHTGIAFSDEHRENIGIAASKRKQKDSTKEKLRKISIEKWKNPEYRERTIKAILEGLMRRPTSFEQKIILLCSKYRLPFIYTGDGRILIGYKNPDFRHKYLPFVIEVFLDYFKIRDYGSVENYMKQRSKHFAKYGYKTIFIREREVNNKNWDKICLDKINKILQ